AVGLWLAVGERAVWELVLWTGRAALPARPALPDVPAAAEAVPPEETALRPRVLMIATSLSRRGPPVPV
ncbi:MAG: MFS transporter, partial [Nocardioidaceae bacterium]|nr:MFS transporter [Nocardioidaceae bacterium]